MRTLKDILMVVTIGCMIAIAFGTSTNISYLLIWVIVGAIFVVLVAFVVKVFLSLLELKNKASRH